MPNNIWWFWYPGGLRGWLKEFKMGWDINDLKSGIARIEAESRPGHIVWLTHREMDALKAEAKANEEGWSHLP